MIAAAWPRIRANPFIGTGLSNRDLIIHNELVAAWYTTGLFGLAGILLVSVGLLLLGWRGAQAGATSLDRVLGWSFVCAFVAFTLFAMTAPLFFQEYGWVAGAMIVAWAALPGPAMEQTKSPSAVLNRRQNDMVGSGASARA